MREIQSSKDLGFFCSVNHAVNAVNHAVNHAVRRPPSAVRIRRPDPPSGSALYRVPSLTEIGHNLVVNFDAHLAVLASSKVREASEQHRGQTPSKLQETGRCTVNEHYFFNQYSAFRFLILLNH